VDSVQEQIAVQEKVSVKQLRVKRKHRRNNFRFWISDPGFKSKIRNQKSKILNIGPGNILNQYLKILKTKISNDFYNHLPNEILWINQG